MYLFKVNINNLTSLWQTAGQQAGQYIEETDYSISLTEDGQWPNKLWLTKQLDNQILHTILLKWNLSELSIPIWGAKKESQEATLKQNGFEEKLSQVAMSMDLSNGPEEVKRVVIQKVTNKAMAETWSSLFREAFGYEISAKTVNKTMESIEYFIGKHDGIPVGTAVLFMNQTHIAGIHSMGIIPSQRRKGYAEELLIHMLNIARMKGATTATLQASDMGKGLYLKTGFQEDFTIKTFIQLNN